MLEGVLFDQIRWRDPITGGPLEPVITARTPAGVPICGALRLPETPYAYPIVDCVARLTPDLAFRFADWLTQLGFQPPALPDHTEAHFQPEATVESFGFQWSWSSEMRSESDLRWRTAERFKVNPSDFAEKIVLDAGAGTGDQSRWLLGQGAAVVSIDLSSAIEVVASKLRMHAGWVGVQGDISVLPIADKQFDIVYCEGVIQHTSDSALTVRELCRVLGRGGTLLATHYGKSRSWLGRVKLAWHLALRNRLSRWERYKLLLCTGNLAALSYVPLLGKMIRLTTVPYYDIMPDFKTTWTNTFDLYGSHVYQRYITPEQFMDYFQQAGELEIVYSEGTLVVARKKERTNLDFRSLKNSAV